MKNNVAQLPVRKRKPINGFCEDSTVVGNNKFLPLLNVKNPAEEARRIELEYGKEAKWDYISNTVKRLYRCGARSHDIAPLFGVDDSTVRKWLAKIRTEQSESMEKADVYQHFAETISIFDSLMESAMDLVYSETTREKDKIKAIHSATRTLAAREKYLCMVGFYANARFEANRPRNIYEKQADYVREKIMSYIKEKENPSKQSDPALTPEIIAAMSDEELDEYTEKMLEASISPKDS